MAEGGSGAVWFGAPGSEVLEVVDSPGRVEADGPHFG